jgi:hypothetical protein
MFTNLSCGDDEVAENPITNFSLNNHRPLTPA